MSRPPLARDKVLDAFEAILIEEGERAATMEATARAAGVSKGGLLYHFGSKDALESALLERLHELVEDDVAAMEASPEGPIAYFLRTSVMENDRIDRAILATSRLAQGGNARARVALRGIRDQWADVLRAHTKDATALDLVMLGVGPDGHVASLFPGHDHPDALVVAEADSPKPPPERISLSMGLICRASRVWIVASGEEKAEAVRGSVAGDAGLPAGVARGADGTRWYVDEAAASRLG